MWDGFAEAVVRIELTTGPVLIVPGDAEAPGADAFPFDSPVHIVTAYNPAGLEADDAVNARQHRELTRRLAAFDVVPTVGSAPDGSMPEPGYAILDVPLETAVRIGRDFGQRAIYRWTRTSLAIVGTDEAIHRHVGWSLAPV